MVELRELATTVAAHHGLNVENVAQALLEMQLTPTGCDELAAHPGRLQPFTVKGAEGEIGGATGWVLYVCNQLQSVAVRCLTDKSHIWSDEYLEAAQTAVRDVRRGWLDPEGRERR